MLKKIINKLQQTYFNHLYSFIVINNVFNLFINIYNTVVELTPFMKMIPFSMVYYNLIVIINICYFLFI